MQLLITRPQAEAEALSQRLAEMGHKALIEPMLTIRTLPDAVLELDAAAALLLTSANGVRALAGRAVDRGMLVLAVGEATAAAARAAGFTNVAAAGGDVVALAALVRKRLRPEDG
ncbi:MAG: uroporphyrinogen-III synthase, partial [Rhodospirillaceae bacterium]|nr:uroporphyrinogen-III synthase [Rhodospirillaceae bacterium]